MSRKSGQHKNEANWPGTGVFVRARSSPALRALIAQPPRAGSVSEVRALIRQPSMRSASQASASPNGAKSMMLAARPPSKKPFRRPWTKGARRPTPTSSGRSRAGHHRTRFTGENEWYTPAEYIEAARACLGAIDLDPATAPVAQKTDPRGPLLHPRRRRPAARVARPDLAQPAVRAAGHRTLRRQAARRDRRRPGDRRPSCSPTTTPTPAGFTPRPGRCAAICFTRGRIRFVSPTGEIAAPTQGQAFFYFGPGVDRFRDTFGGFGFIR